MKRVLNLMRNPILAHILVNILLNCKNVNQVPPAYIKVVMRKSITLSCCEQLLLSKRMAGGEW